MRGFGHGQRECATELLGVLNWPFAQPNVFPHLFLAQKVPYRQALCLFSHLRSSNGHLRHRFNLLGRSD